MPGGGAELHAEEDRAERQGELPEQPAQAARRVGVELAQVERRRHGGRTLLLRLDHGLEDGPVGVQDAEAPLPRPDGLEGDAAGARGGADPRGLGHMHLGDAGQLLEGDADQRIGVLVLAAVRGDPEGQGAGGLEPAVARSRS